ncbi:MAG: LuxR C-terminal-related transcriptional regulator [Pseudonocardiaceae bacterium]
MVQQAWPLVGRARELGHVAQALAAGHGAVFAGQAGVGKSRLLVETVALAQASGARALTVRASRSSASMPLGAFAPLLDPTVASPSLATARRDILVCGADALMVVCLDDAHLLDEASAALIYQLAADDGIVIFTTVRSREAAPEAVVGLWKDGPCERVEVPPLSRDELDELVGQVLGGTADGAARHALWMATQGNPLFARELLTAALADGTLAESQGVWTLTCRLRAPPRLWELLADRLGDLDGPARTAAELIALGEPLPLEVVVTMVGEDAAERLEEQGLIEIDGIQRALAARLAHPLFGDVLLDRLGTLKRRRLLRDLASALIERGAEDEQSLRITRWRIEAGLQVSPETLLIAAQRCQLVDPELAAGLCRRAIEAGARVTGTVALADVLMFSGRGEEAAALLDATDAETTDERTSLRLHAAMILAFGLGRPQDAADRLEQLASEVDDDHWGEVVSRLVTVRLLTGEVDRTLAVVDTLLTDPRATAEHRLRGALVHVPLLLLSGQLSRTIQRAAEIVPRLLASDEVDAYGAAQVATLVGLAHLYAGELDRAEAVLHQLYEEASRTNVRLVRGACALRLGQLARARQMCQEAVASLDGDEMTLASAVDHLRLALALTGQLDAPDPLATSPLYAVELGWLRAALTGERGERSSACRQALEAADLGIRTGQYLFASIAVFEAARQGGARQAARRIADMPDIDGSLIPALLSAVQALADADPQALEDIATRLEQQDVLLYAAELASAASHSYHCAGLKARAFAMRARTQKLAARCEGAATTSLRIPAAAAELTAREHEIAGLAARGLSDAAIAERLFISQRTVESHLHHTYTKLGISGRDELPKALDLTDS